MGVCELAYIYEELRKTLKRMSHNAGRFGAIRIRAFVIQIFNNKI